MSQIIVTKFTDRTEYRNSAGNLHSVNDEPALVTIHGDKVWYNDGKVHRLGNPAYISDTYGCFYTVNGKFHRLDGPADLTYKSMPIWYAYGIKLKPTEYTSQGNAVMYVILNGIFSAPK